MNEREGKRRVGTVMTVQLRHHNHSMLPVCDRGLGRYVITQNVDVPPLTHIHTGPSKRNPSLLSA